MFFPPLYPNLKKMPLLYFFLFLFFFTPTRSLNQPGLYLQTVKHSLYDPLQVLSSWNDRDTTPCDNWYGVTCDNGTGDVIKIDLSNSSLSGSFPIFFCHLTTLSSLSLYNNSINSSLPSDLPTCGNLTHLNLESNLLTGTLPDSLVEIPNLVELNLAGNNFSGEIPARFGEFKRLEILNLAGNLLTGSVPGQLGNIGSLRELLIAYNPFSQSRIPFQLGKLTRLEILWMTDCNLVGEIPYELFTRMTRLWNLDLSQNRLSGSIPSSITELVSAEQIELYNNSLSGELPRVGLKNLKKLRRFDASMNELTGPIPTELTELELESLNMYENRLEGTLPESIAGSKNLYELKLFNNKLSGELPSQLGVNSPLKWVDVSYNEFHGQIPEHLCSKGYLEDLILIYNSFSGKIPESLGKCESLGRVRLRNNKLSGNVPEELWGLPRVYLFEVFNNMLSGEVSEKVSNAKNLSVLLISSNSFSGVIPSEIGYLENLIEFSGSNNMFTGPIPGSLVKLKMLNRLVLSGNQLSGGIPAGIRGWKSLNELNLANNMLSGSIPNDIGDLPVLNYLDLSGNRFSGEIPLELQKLKLNLLNLSNNMLSGDLPPLYAKEAYRQSFLGNPGLCGDLKGLCPSSGDSKKLGYLWILRSIFVVAGLVLVVGVVWFYVKYKSLKKGKKGMALSKWRSFHKLGFSELEISNCLKEDNVIGSGASGKVYKVMLSNGDTVAVKKLNGGVKRGDAFASSDKDEFEVEVETLGKIRHKNIVRLWCCCSSGDCKLLVYEYMPNGSLGDFLHGTKAGLLDWPKRYKIALDAAEGLSYLHHDCVLPIVHRDVKSNNILLDAEYGARVADFGVAKIVRGVNKGTEPMSVIAGSCGYIAPEYAYTLRVNEKSDIFSFGVVLLELVTGRLPIDPEFGEKDLVRWVHTSIEEQGMNQVIDPKLDSSYKDEICKVLEVALCCTSSLPISRPSMRRVVKMLLEAGGGSNLKIGNRDGKLSPYYQEEASDQGSAV